jgi:uncharacterized protein DUF3618
MTRRVEELEREIAETRARLDRTLGALRNKLSVGGIADELAGSARAKPLVSLVEEAVQAARRNPVPVMLVAAGVGLLFYEMKKDKTRISASYQRIDEEAADVPVLNTGQARIYDPDAPTLHPTTRETLAAHDMSTQV